jgi:hypothetical protein
VKHDDEDAVQARGRVRERGSGRGEAQDVGHRAGRAVEKKDAFVTRRGEERGRGMPRQARDAPGVLLEAVRDARDLREEGGGGAMRWRGGRGGWRGGGDEMRRDAARMDETALSEGMNE